ncbi:hypothetical protein AAG570_008908 [Ranatra chinensis]|uniref:CAF17 C-terminal domain-containing protein n=1 Tax=Ranatra chinensis TaxID=642074 RepID=A0ABD0YSW9_9HEMI
MYKLKKNVEIRNVEHEMSVWAIFNPHFDPLDGASLGDGVLLCRDPRLSSLGYRVLAPKKADILAGVRAVGLNLMRSSVPMYTAHRYRLGVGEGIDEIPYGKYLTLEANGDYLNGVSEKKTGFLGHELMSSRSEAKRLMPVLFESEPSVGCALNSPIEDMMGRSKTPLGYLMGIEGRVGLGLMRVANALTSGNVKLKNVFAKCIKPYWWP